MAFEQSEVARLRWRLAQEAYLSKPFRVEQLLTVVQEVLHTPHPVFRAKEWDGETSVR